MANYEVTVECRMICSVKIEADSEGEACQKVEEMSTNDLGQYTTNEETEITDVYELETQ